MVTRIKAIGRYRPRIVRGPMVQKGELVENIADRTGLNEGEIALVLAELRDAVLHHNRLGRPVKLEGLGIYRPVIRLDGSIKVVHKLDGFLKKGLNTPGAFRGRIINREFIGKSSDDLVAQWNVDHPGDPIP